ncbi:phosphoribosyltransferase family protein [Nocardia otitidiscaviarum]|uniref:phosphoribosyltransferase family protein n=1 Tax=Nocardia otitidiscaviarum TaxID=1823 RepID=UPI0018959FF9|nr:phosphoribosyltransferase family protein [Nocardia otitidiscaviarum]MBF6181449.1 phosphoribosyltransferase [Nocardia otitidiscaviarum]
MYFEDRAEAGRQLARHPAMPRGVDVVVLGLPRGGVPVASEVARSLDAALDVIVVRKLGVPHQPELAFGALGEDGISVLNDDVVASAGLTDDDMAPVEHRERIALERRVARFRAGRPRLSLAGRTAVIVDDGAATGATVRAACQVARTHGAERVVVAVPVASRSALRSLRREADDVICLEQPMFFHAVGQWYHRFGQTSDSEVVELLDRAAARTPRRVSVPSADPSLRDDEVRVRVGDAELAGHLTVPEDPIGMVVFVHGSGSSRHSPRNRYVAGILHRAGLGTLLFDLLTPAEEVDRANVFDIELLARRLVDVTGWLGDQEHATGLSVGYFGASTGAAAALRAAADPRVRIDAVVSRGGRPDLAGDALAAVRAPTLLIVGGHDHHVMDLNRTAAKAMSCEVRLIEIPGATHLFEEPGTLSEAAQLARDWFVTRLRRADEANRVGAQ